MTKTLKTTLAIVISVIMLAACAVVSFAAQSGTSSDGKIAWTLDDEGLLTIKGSGDCTLSKSVTHPYITTTDVKEVVIECENGKLTISTGMFSGFTNLKKATLGDGVANIPGGCFDGCSSFETLIIGKDVEKINGGAFGGTVLKNVTFSEGSSTNILSGAFSGCSYLEELVIPDSDITVGSNNAPVFGGCTSLKKITVGAKTISSYAFLGLTALEEVTITSNVENIGSQAFAQNTKLTTANIYSKTIGDYMFGDCKSLVNLTIGDNVETIGDYAFAGCTSLKTVDIGDGVVSIGNCAFSGCSSIESVTLGEKVKTIGYYVFTSSSGKAMNLVLPESVETIGNNAFVGLGIAKLYVGSNLTSCGANVFTNAAYLTDVYYAGTQEEWNNNNISYCPAFINTTATFHFEHEHSFDYVSNNDATYTQDGTKTGTCECSLVSTVTDEGSMLVPETTDTDDSENTCGFFGMLVNWIKKIFASFVSVFLFMLT